MIKSETQSNSPLLSVLMTAYNRELYIAEAIQSVVESGYENFELIIVDDGSKDKTVSIAEQYAATDHRIRVFVNEKNLGDYPNRNQAAGYANGEFITYVDSDDKILPGGFQQCIDAMSAFPQAGIGMQLHENKPSKAFYLNKREALYRHFFIKPCLTIGPG